MKKILTGIFIAAAALFTSCNDFLDMKPTDKVSDKMMWETTKNAEMAVNYIYSFLLDVYGNQCEAGKTDALADQVKYGSYNFMSLCYIPSEIAYGGSTLSASYVDAYLGYWSAFYSKVRKTNEGISNLKKYGKMEGADALRLEAEMRMVRAFIYFDLVKRYKDIILYDEDMSAITKDKNVTPEQECWNFIYNDLKFAAETLPTKEAAKGRANKGMAWGIMSRAMLYAGRWEDAKAAAIEVEKLGYDLEADYTDAFMKTTQEGNKEAVIQYQFSLANNLTHNTDFYYTPGGDFALIGNTGGGWGTPTQEIVESYELATGGFPDWSEWHTAEGTTAEPPYKDLEPRFQASVLYNGADWKGRKIEPFVGGIDGWSQWRVEPEPKGRTTTGYYLRKLVDESHDLTERSQSLTPSPILRFAEVLLNKAEACYRTGDVEGANEAIRKIRKRVNLPYTDKSGEELWAAIRQERKIELAFEDQWYWDLRRWGDSHKDYPVGLSNYQVHGLKIEKTPSGEFRYTYVSVDDKDRNFPSKMYRFPLPQSELSSNGALTQITGW